MNTNRLFTFLLCITALSACASLKVTDVRSDEGFDLSKYQSYHFYGLKPNGDTVLLTFTYGADILESEIANQLNARGLLISRDPDLFINTNALLEDKIKTRETDIRETPRSLGVDTWSSKEVVEDSYREGAIIVHFLDRKQKKIVWQGTAEGVVPSGKRKLKSNVKKIVSDFFVKIP